MTGLSRLVDTLRIPTVRSFSGARLSGYLAESLIEVSLVLLAWAITQDSFKVALVTLAMRVPSWLFPIAGGVLTDRLPTMRIIVAANVTLGAASVLLFASQAAAGELYLGALIVFAFFSATARTFDAVALFKQVKEVSTPETINALNAISDSGKRIARIIAPYGLAIAATFMPPVATLLAIPVLAGIAIWCSSRLPTVPAKARNTTVLAELREAIHVLQKNTALTSAIAIDAIFSIAYQAIYWVVLPRHVMGDIGMAPQVYASAIVFVAIGGLAGGVVSGSVAYKDRLAVVYWTKAIGIVAFSYSCIAASSIGIYAGAATMGFLLAFERVALDGFVQMVAPEGTVGKVFGFWRLSVEVCGSLGILIVGYCIGMFGAAAILTTLVPTCLVIMTLLFWMARSVVVRAMP